MKVSFRMPFRRSGRCAVVLLAWLLTAAQAPPSGIPQAAKPDPKYKTWLEEEVNYLITDAERKLFLSLKTDRERNTFIASFWARRDPFPMTQVNEFKEEHDRRLAEAKEKYGLRSDRGRIFILLGTPDSVDNETSGKYVVPCEVWNYFSLNIPSFPSSLRLLFFKQWGVGDFRLYSPLFDGLEYLVPQRHYDFAAGENTELRRRISEFMGPEFLRATESVAPGVDQLQSEKVLGTLRDTQAFQELRASAGRPVVTTTVTYEKLPFTLGGFFVDDGHGNFYYDAALTVSPADLTFEQGETKSYGRADVYVTVKDAGGNIVARANDQLGLELAPEEMEVKKGYGLNYAFTELLVPGDYTLNVLLRDYATNRVGERELKLSLPAAARSTPLLLGSRAERLSASPSGRRPPGPASTPGKNPFAFGDLKVQPRPSAAFGREETIVLYFEVYARAGDSGQYSLHYAVRDTAGTAVMSSSEVQSLPGGERTLAVLKTFSPKGLKDAAYTLSVEVGDAVSGARLFDEAAGFSVTAGTRPPGFFSFEQPYAPAPEDRYTRLGLQALYRKDLPAAGRFFTLALSAAPGYVPAKLQLARCRVLEGQDGPALDLLLPLAKEGLDDSDLYTILANIYYGRRDLDRAAAYLEKAADLNVESVEVLNFLGAVYMEKGAKDKAREAFGRSLKIREDQPLVKAALERLGK
jgi:GWxTD domain-containing protein